MSNLQIHKPLCRIITYDGETFYIPEEMRTEIEENINSNPYGCARMQGDITIKFKDIKKIEKHSALGYEDLPPDLRGKVEMAMQKYKENTGEKPTEAHIQVMIKKALAGNL